MSAELSFYSNIVQLLLVVGIIILIGGYFYYENMKMKNKLLELDYKIEKLSSLFNYDNINDDLSESQFIPNLVNSNNIQMDTFPQELIPESLTHHMKQNDNIKAGLSPDIKLMNNQTDTVLREDNIVKVDGVERENRDNIDTVDNLNEVDAIDKVESIDSEWSDIDNLMKDDNVNCDDVEDVKSNNEDNPLKSFSIDDMLKDISGDNINAGGTEDLLKRTPDRNINIKSCELNYDSMTVTELKQILVEKNLPVSGNKTKLIQRILDNK